jgi:hypothetical protein
LEDHVGGRLFDLTLVNNNFSGNLPGRIEFVRPDPAGDGSYLVHRADLLDELNPWRHDSRKLSQRIIDLYQEKTGPMVE